jgi:hypothetical protein
MSDGYGSGDYGTGLPDETTLETAEGTFNHPLLRHVEGTTTHDLLAASVEALVAVDESLGAIADAQHLDTATDEHLDMIGELVGEPRQDGDDDPTYRQRIRAGGGLIYLRPTNVGCHQYVRNVLESESFSLSRTDGGVMEISATSSTWDDATLTRSEIIGYVTEFLPEGHRAEKLEELPTKSIDDNEVVTVDSPMTLNSTLNNDGTLNVD